MSDSKKYMADIVICVHNALEDVKICVQSVFEKTKIDFQLIIINDGSDKETTEYLRSIKKLHSNFNLIENKDAIGYTKSANLGLKSSKADHVALMNSDVIVTENWLARLIDCANSSSKIGMVGPLSNAASWQSVPERFDSNGDWAINELPVNETLDNYAVIISKLSNKNYPRVKLLNGVCTLYKRNVLNTVGYLDEANFPRGYGEENDYCLRAIDAGYELVIDDSTYIFHAKSKSFGHETRKELSKNGNRALLEKHGNDKLKVATHELKFNPVLQELRMELKKKFSTLSESLGNNLEGNLKVLFLLPVSGVAGGIHSIFQEVMGMRQLNVNAKIATWKYNEEAYFNAYPNVNNLLDHFFFFTNYEDLISYCNDADVVVATINHSVILLKRIYDRFPKILPVYYVQDYEPFFFEKGNVDWKIAFDSYSIIPEILCMAKTDWLCETVGNVHNVAVEKVSPSLDTTVYYPDLNLKSEKESVKVVAMIRPSTPRRGAERTMRVLKKIKDEHKEKVNVIIFGTPEKYLDEYNLETDFEYENIGIINREEVSSTLRNSDVFIDFSIYQAFGRTGLEAMASGCATVLTERGGTGEYAVHEHNSLLVDTSSDEDCYNSLNRIIADKELRQEIIYNGIKDAAHYSIRRAVISELAVFNKYIKNRQNDATVFVNKDISEADRFYNKNEELVYDLISVIYYLEDYSTFNKDSFVSTLNLLRDKDEIVVLTYNPDLIKDFNNTESENTIKIVRIEKEVDKTAAYNLSLDHAENPFLCFVDANTQLPTDYLTSIGRFTTNKKIGVIGPLLNISFGSQNISSYSSDLKINSDVNLINKKLVERFSDQIVSVSNISTKSLLVRREVFQKIEGFNSYENFEFVELDFLWRMKEAGFEIGLVLDTYCEIPKQGSSNLKSIIENCEDDKEKLFNKLLENYGAEALLSSEKIWDLEELNFDSIINKRKKSIVKEKSDKDASSKSAASIVVLTYNSSKTVSACLNSAIKTKRDIDELILVDNASEDDTCDLVESIIKNVSNVKFIKNNDNLGFSAGTNVGIEHSKNPFIVLLNPDTIVVDNWIQNLLTHFDEEDVAAVGPISNYVAGYQKMELHSGKDFPDGESLEGVYNYFDSRNKGQEIESKLLIGFCLAVKKEVLDKHGNLDEKLFLGNDDLELSWRLRENGYKLKIALDTFVYHEGQQSFNTKPNSLTDRLVQESTDALFIKLENYYGKGNVPSSSELWDMDWFKPSSHLLSPSVNKTKDEKTPTNSIIALTYNQLKYTHEFVQSIFEHTADYELIIVDNNSSDGTKEYLEEIAKIKDNVTIICNTENNGFPIAVNQGILAAKGKNIIIANNDIIVTDGWLERMIVVANSNNNVGIVGPISNSVSGVQLDENAKYSTIPEMIEYAINVKDLNKGKVSEFPRVAFLCTLIKREVIEKIGGLDERFTPGNFEDDDFCLRAQLVGYKTVIAHDVFVHHYGSVSFKHNGTSEYAERLQINEKKFIEKWGNNPEGIWINGSQPIKRKIEFPIHTDLFNKSISRAFINIDDEEYNFALENLKIAIENFDDSKRIGYENVSKEELLNIAGNISLAKNDLELAKEYFEEELKQNPNSSNACFGLGELFHRAEMLNESKTMFEWAIVNNSNNNLAVEKLMEINSSLNLPQDHNSLLIEESESN